MQAGRSGEGGAVWTLPVILSWVQIFGIKILPGSMDQWMKGSEVRKLREEHLTVAGLRDPADVSCVI